MSEHVRVTVDAGVMTIVLARPEKKNAITQAMYRQMADSLAHAENDPSVRVVLFRGEGADFTAGNDLMDFAAMAAGTLRPEDTHWRDLLTALARATKPFVAAVQGAAVGIGVTLLLHCDYVVVASDAKLVTPFVNLGLVPEAGSSILLQARIGYARAFQMMALGEPLSGQAAAAIGLVNEAVATDQVGTRALSVAQQLASRAPAAMRATKQLMRDSAGLLIQMDREVELFQAQLRSPEFAEAARAFRERRPADFSGTS